VVRVSVCLCVGHTINMPFGGQTQDGHKEQCRPIR